MVRRPRPASGAATPVRRRPSRGRRPCPRERRRSPRESREGRTRPDGGHVQRVAALVEQLEEVAEAPFRVGREDPRRPRRPGTARRLVRSPCAHPQRERDRDRRTAGPRQDVVRDPEVARIRPEGGQVRVVERLQPVRRHEPVEPSRSGPGHVPVVPRLDPAGTDDRPPRREDLVEHPLERPGRKAQCDRIRLDRRAVLGPARGARPEQPPIRAAVAAIAVDDPPDRLERLEQGPARAGSSSVASRPRTVGRSIVSRPNRSDSAACP